MIAVIFEVTPAPGGGREGYLAIAASLAEELHGVDGFLSVERFESLVTPGKLLSLSFWRDEAAIADWRNRERHRAAQQAGRNDLFASYRLRIAEVVRDYDAVHRDQAPADSRVRHG
jgi:heme-degrading monooxygenase HmoA